MTAPILADQVGWRHQELVRILLFRQGPPELVEVTKHGREEIVRHLLDVGGPANSTNRRIGRGEQIVAR